MAKLVDTSTGRVVVTDDAEAVELVESGLYRPASADDVQQEARRLELSDTGSTLAAAAEGAASGATFGLSDVAIQEGLLGDEFAEESRLRAEYNPVARGVGEGAGMIGTTIASGGLGGISTLGRGATTALGRAAGAVGGAALEGAIQGAGHGLSEAALAGELDDMERVAERVALEGGMGALLGSGFAAGGELVGAVARKGFSAAKGAGARALGRAAEQASKGGDEALGALDGGLLGAATPDGLPAPTAAGEAAGQAGRQASGQADDLKRLLGDASDQDVDVLQSLRDPANDIAHPDDAWKAARDLDSLQQEGIRTLRDGQRKITQLSDETREAFAVGQKPKVLRQLIEEGHGPPASVAESARAQAEAIFDQVNQLAKRTKEFEEGGKTAVARMQRQIKARRKELGRVLEQTASDPAEQAVQAFRELDQIKRDLGKAQVAATRGANGSQHAGQLLQDVREGLRGMLEDEAVWGTGFAGFQRKLNEAWAPLIDVDSAFARKFQQASKASHSAGKSKYDLTRQLADPNSDAISQMLKGLTRAEGEVDREGLYLLKMAREAQYQRTAAELMGDPAAKAAADEIEALVREQVAVIDKLRSKTRDVQKYANAMETVTDVPLIGGKIGEAKRFADKAIGWARDQFAGTGEGMLATTSRAGGERLRRAGGAIARAARTKAPAAARKAARQARRAGTYLGVRVAGEMRGDQYHQIAGRVRELREDKRRRAQDVPRGGATAFNAQLERGLDFLARKAAEAPGGKRGGDLYAAARKPASVDARTAERFRRYVDAVQDPAGILERAEDGELRREDVEVLREVYPRLYQDLMGAVVDEIAQTPDGKLPSYQDRVRLGLLFGVPTDPSMTPAGLQMTEASAARAAVAPGDGTGPGGVVAGPGGPGGPGPGGAGGQNGAATGGPPPEVGQFFGPAAERTVIGTRR